MVTWHEGVSTGMVQSEVIKARPDRNNKQFEYECKGNLYSCVFIFMGNQIALVAHHQFSNKKVR